MSIGDVRILKQMRGWAIQTEQLHRDVAEQIDNKQVAQVLRNCANDRSAMIERLDAVIAELGDGDPDHGIESCCDPKQFRTGANDDLGTLLERLASCDMTVHDRLAKLLDGVDIKASTHLIADEAKLLLHHTARKLRRINEQANSNSGGATIEKD